MRIISVALVAWGLFFLVRLALVPRTDAWADANRNVRGIRAAAISSLAGYLSFSSFMVAMGTTAAWCVQAAINAAGGTTVQEAQRALDWVDRAAHFSGRFGAGVGVATTILLIMAFSFHAYLSGARHRAESTARAGKMRKVLGEIGELDDQLRRLQVNEPARERVLEQHEALVHKYRRLESQRSEDELGEAGGPSLVRVLRFVSSAGMLLSLKGLGRVGSATGLILLLPASMTVGLPGIQAAAEEKVLELEARVWLLERDDDGNVWMSEENEEGETRPPKDEAVPPEDEAASTEDEVLSPEDEAAIDVIASIFESEVVQEVYLPGLEAVRPSARTSETTAKARATRSILEAAVSDSAAASQRVRSTSPDSFQQRVLDLNEKGTGPRRPATSYGERLRADAREWLRRFRPAVWRKIRDNVTEYARLFRDPLNPRDVRAMLLSDWLGDLVGRGVEVPGVLGDLLREGVAGFTGDVAEAAYREEALRFLVALAKADHVPPALRSLAEAPQPLTRTMMDELRNGLREVPTPANIPVWPSSLSVGPRPRLDEAGAKKAVLALAQFPDSGAVVDALVGYDDLFPGQRSENLSSPYREVLDTLERGRGVSGTRGGDPAPRETRYWRSRSYQRLRGRPEIGGVLLGRPPEVGARLEVERLKWRVTEGEVALWLVRPEQPDQDLGRFDAAIVHSALAYAADGRIPIVTILPVESLGDWRILLHPALVDTGLGCSAIRLDQLVDEARHRNQALRDLRENQTEEVYRQHRAYLYAWGLRIRALRELKLPTYLQLESEQRERLGATTDLLATRLAPGLSVGDFDFLLAKPEFYDERLVKTLRECRLTTATTDFDQCVRSTATADTYGADSTASWAAPWPRFNVASGVREQAWEVDETASFISSDEPLGPFRFVVRVAFTSPAWYGSEAPWHSGSTSHVELFEDETPYELTSLAGPLKNEIASHANEDEAVREVIGRMAEFTHLQRLFRAIIDGQIVLTRMEPVKLAELAVETAGRVNRTPTADWLPKPQLFEKRLEETGSADHRSELSALRSSLGLTEEEAIWSRVVSSGCPAPGNEAGPELEGR